MNVDVLGRVGRYELERRFRRVVEVLGRAVRELGRCPYCHGAGSFREGDETPPCVPCQGTGLVEAARKALENAGGVHFADAML